MSERILIVEDEDTLRESLCRVFEREGYETASVSNAEAALELFDEGTFDLVITDIILPGISGIELVRRIREASPDQSAVVMTAYASLETAVETLRAGAYDYIVKPIIHEEIKQTVRNALRLRTLQLENELLKKESADQYEITRLVGTHPEISALRERLRRLADSLSPVLLKGEIGTGKKLVARAIHTGGRRPRFPFIEFHCAHYSPEEQEKELFSSKGLLKRIRNGTIYFNRVEGLGENCQRRLLSVMEERQLRLGANETALRFDALVISSTEGDPEVLVSEGRLLQRLYERLSTFRINLPPLRERINDIEDLCEFFVSRYSRAFSKNVSGTSSEALELLRTHTWPGNVLELRNVLERAVLMTKNTNLIPEDFPALGLTC
ncbi:MAG: sigma-54-dependent Fis family transcriptional regulator [Desulfobacteraceae bacterium]|jgi:DNA-binding NtrC family response regulator|nr:MAG: sigma-54-dependent Fis family transcriptional regulator [Desulfobacteraceae bacterium]